MDLLKILIIISISIIEVNATAKEIGIATMSKNQGDQMGSEVWSNILSVDWKIENGHESEFQKISNMTIDKHLTKILTPRMSLCEHFCCGPSCQASSSGNSTSCKNVHEVFNKDGGGVSPLWKTGKHNNSKWTSKQSCICVSHNCTNTSYTKTLEARKHKSDLRAATLANLLADQHLRKKERDTKLAKEMERIEKKLSPLDKWHFMVGYTDFEALREAERLIENSIQHVSTKKSVKYFLTFIPKHLAQKMRTNPKFILVKPLVGTLKIEGLNLGSRLLYIEGRHDRPSLQREISLKANLAKNEITASQAMDISRRWEYTFKTNASPRSCEEQYEPGMNLNCEPKLLKSTLASIQRYAMRITCVAPDETAIICHGIHNQILRHVVEFMASEALVQLVEIKPCYKVFNYWSKQLLQSVSRGHTPIYDAGIRGEGEIIAHSDTGIDMHHCFFFDKDRPIPYNYIDYDARKVIQYKVLEGGDFFDLPMGHGTHVAGSIAGDTEVGRDSFSGMAPAAKIAFFDMGAGPYELVNVPNNLGRGLFIHGYRTGARIFCNSWGDMVKGYGSGPHDVDSFSYENPDVLILFAAGNDGHRGASSIASPAISKNCLAVGASLNAMDSFQSILPSDELLPFEFLTTVAPFSSVGPTLDGRTKPDILAPGMEIWSSASQGAGQSQSCQVLPNQGTSCATPLLAGAAALARQYFREGYYPLGSKNFNNSFIPSGALLKAILIHSGVHMDAYFSPVRLEKLINQPPNNMEGYGRVVLERVLVFSPPLEGGHKPPSRLLVKSGADHGATLEHGKKHVMLINILSDMEALHITMVWMDPPAASGSSNPMINDLDLVVTEHDKFPYFPNGMTAKDSTNNVEAVLVRKPSPGAWKVEVKASRIMTKIQPYALVITGHFLVLDDQVVSSALNSYFGPFGFYYPTLLVLLTTWFLYKPL